MKSGSAADETATRDLDAPGPNEELLEGSVHHIIFRNEQTGWTVLVLELIGQRRRGESHTATLVGSIASVWQGEDLRAVGTWKRDEAHGMQFVARRVTCIPPTSTDGICRYLASSITKGIGPKLARRIVDTFGANTLDVLEHHSARLREVPGLGEKKREALKRSWNANHGTREAMIFLQGHGITSGTSARIYRHYGADTVAVVKSDPYRLCRDVDRIGFLKADEIARKLGIPRDSPLRAAAGIYHTLQSMAEEEGHCFLERTDLLLRAEDKLQISAEILSEALNAQIENKQLIDDGNRIYLKRYFRAETLCAKYLRALGKSQSKFSPERADSAINWVQHNKLSFTLSEAQRQAVKTTLTNKLSVITGGPGVGKTTVIRALCEIWEAVKLDLHLVAPTGRAARRMSESSGRQAQTIHRLLKWNPQTAEFVYNANNKLRGDVFVVDESSMIDIELAAQFLAAIPQYATLVFVGDVDQLPSVGPGSVLKDLIDSREVPYTKLEYIFRQKDGGYIVRNAHLINNGEWLETPSGDVKSDFFFIRSEDRDQLLRRVLELVRNRIPLKWNLSPLEDIQVLTPMRKNTLGTDNLNRVLQAELNPTGRGVRRFDREFRVGDRVMQIRNNYDKDVFNGDIGFVHTVAPDVGSLSVDFDGTHVSYAAEELDELTLAYASTIHKSQGSEYPAVIVVLSGEHHVMLQRNLLYTAVTRGRKLVCVVGSKFAVERAIKHNESRVRNTALSLRLGPDPLPKVETLPETT